MPLAVRRGALGAALTLVVGLLLLGIWGLVAGLAAREDLQQVRSVVTALREEPPDDLDGLREGLQPARGAAARARSRLNRPGPALVARLPVVGPPLAVERDAALAADVLLRTADLVLADVASLSATGGRVDVVALERVAHVLTRAADDVRAPAARLAVADPVLAPESLRVGLEQAREVLTQVDPLLRDASAAARAVAGLLGADGPRTVVVVLMNNAELRGAGGYGGSFAVVRTDGGRLDVGPFRDVNDVQDDADQARRLPAPQEYARRWGPYLADSTLWKNVLMSADQPTSASVACAVARLAPGVPCDAVVLLDVPALAGLVELSGPVDLGGGEPAGGQDLIRALLVEAYADVPDTVAAQRERRRRLRAAADEAVSGLLGSRLGGIDAARTLLASARGRHLSVWSAREHEQAAFRRAGVAGGVDPDGADLNLVAVNQLSAGKLDYYVTRSVGLLAVIAPDVARVTQKVTLTLDAPPDVPRYVQGVRGGRLEELMDIAVSPAARDVVVRRDGREVQAPVVEESGSRRVALEVALVDGQSTTWEVSYSVPLQDGRYRLELLPQPLARDAVLHLAVVPADGHRLVGGQVRYDGPYDVRRTVDVRLS